MKRHFLLPTLFLASISISLISCEESGDDSIGGLGDLTAVGISGVSTSNVEQFCCWNSGTNIHFSSGTSDYSTWNISLNESNGYFQQLNNDPLHWRGSIVYYEKDKKCEKEDVYLDSISLDITTSESGWGEGVFRTGYVKYEKGTYPGYMNMTTYYIRPEGGNFNTLNVLDANHAYIFRFKLKTANDFNAWKIEQMPQGWMNSNGKMSMLMVPILYGLFQ